MSDLRKKQKHLLESFEDYMMMYLDSVENVSP